MDYAFPIVGSRFGGSVSTLRLAQKGYSLRSPESHQWRRRKG